MTSPTLAPPEQSRPKLWSFYRSRGLSRREVGQVFSRTAEWVRLVCLPFGDPKRRIPSEDDIRIARDWSGGEIRPSDWYPPELSETANLSSQPEGLAS